MIRATCPNVRHLPALLEEERPEGTLDDLLHHLETCADCQQTLDTLAADPVAWEYAARGLTDAARTEPALRGVMERLKGEDSLSAENHFFLRPADKEGLIGLLGPYEVQEEVGRGGMGVVFKALDPALNRVVAVKVLSPFLAGSVSARRRFVREGRAVAAVCHDHIVTVHGVYEADGLPYLVMQYVAGESLQDRLDRLGPLEAAEVVRIGMQTALGLAAAHTQGLIHRDVKPANLLLEGEPGASATGVAPRVKITDFGLARMVDDVGLTQNGVVAGTPEYMAPEQARGEPIDHRADLFSLGSVLYAMCTGVPPFHGSTAVAVLRQVSDQTPAPVGELNPDVPAWLAVIVDRLMAKDPADRFQSAVEVAALLEGCLVHLRQPTTVKAPELPFLPGGESLDRSTSRPRPLFGSLSPAWFAIVGVLVVLGVGVSFFFPQNNEPTKLAEKDGEKPGKQDHVLFDLRAGLGRYPALCLFGPEANSVVNTDGQGLRITLPEGRKDANTVGLELLHRIRGDFDIVLGYELLAVGGPTPMYGAGVQMRIWFDAPRSLSALVGRSRKPHGEEFGAHRLLEGPDGKDEYKDNKHQPATRQKGKLRFTRTGGSLRYLVAEEGQDFRVMQSLPIGTHDVKTLRVNCQTMYRPIALDVRLSTLDVRADKIQIPNELLPDNPLSAAPEKPAAPEKTEAQGLLVVVELIGLAIVLSLVTASGLWLYRRHVRRGEPQAQADPASPPISFACGDCGKNLKARAGLAGKKVKCIHCGKAAVVP